MVRLREVFVYLLFFLYAQKRRKVFTVACAATIFLGMTVLTNWTLPVLNRNMARAMVGFFVGAVAFQLMERLERARLGVHVGVSCLVAIVAIASIARAIGYDAWVGGDPLPYGLVLFPLLTVASLYVRPLSWLLSLRPLTVLGDISYAVYLSHVPMQMIPLAVARAHKFPLPTSSRSFFWAWIATLIALGTAVHYGFELPVQRGLRRRLSQRASPAAVANPPLTPVT